MESTAAQRLDLSDTTRGWPRPRGITDHLHAQFGGALDRLRWACRGAASVCRPEYFLNTRGLDDFRSRLAAIEPLC